MQALSLGRAEMLKIDVFTQRQLSLGQSACQWVKSTGSGINAMGLGGRQVKSTSGRLENMGSSYTEEVARSRIRMIIRSTLTTCIIIAVCRIIVVFNSFKYASK